MDIKKQQHHSIDRGNTCVYEKKKQRKQCWLMQLYHSCYWHETCKCVREISDDDFALHTWTSLCKPWSSGASVAVTIQESLESHPSHPPSPISFLTLHASRTIEKSFHHHFRHRTSHVSFLTLHESDNVTMCTVICESDSARSETLLTLHASGKQTTESQRMDLFEIVVDSFR